MRIDDYDEPGVSAGIILSFHLTVFCSIDVDMCIYHFTQYPRPSIFNLL